MRIKGKLLMPSLAALTIIAIVVTGIVLGQLRGGVPAVALLGSVQQFASVAEPDMVVAETDAVSAEPEAMVIADSGPVEDRVSLSQQPDAQQAGAQQALLDGSVAVGTKQESADQQPEASVIISSPSVSEGSTGSDDAQVEENPPAPGLPDATEGDAGLRPTNRPTEGTSGFSGETGSEETRSLISALLTSSPSVDSAAHEEAAVVLLAAAERDSERTESTSDEVGDEDED